MKAVFPKNIQKGILAGMNFNIWPFTVSVFQLFILAIGIAIAFVVFNQFAQSSKAVGIFFAVLIFLIFAVIAFFKISELNLLAFIVKFIQNQFFDTTQKYQTNYTKNDKMAILIEKSKHQNTKQKIEYKTWIELENIDKLDTSSPTKIKYKKNAEEGTRTLKPKAYAPQAYMYTNSITSAYNDPNIPICWSIARKICIFRRIGYI